jgi:hypothetical protein
VRYDVVIDVTYLADGRHLDPAARASLHDAIVTDLAVDRGDDLAATAFSLDATDDGAVTIRASLTASSYSVLTSRSDAAAHLDGAFKRALMRTGLFEEFDVIRRTVRVLAVEGPR